MEWWMVPLLLFVGIPVIYIVGELLVDVAYDSKKQRKRQRAERQRAKEEAKANEKHNAEVDKLVGRYVNASFTKECANSILTNYQQNISYCKDHRLSQWRCTIETHRIVLMNSLGIDYTSNGYANLNWIDVEAFTKAIMKNLPSDFKYSVTTDYDSGRVVCIYHDIPIPELKNIADS